MGHPAIFLCKVQILLVIDGKEHICPAQIQHTQLETALLITAILSVGICHIKAHIQMEAVAISPGILQEDRIQCDLIDTVAQCTASEIAVGNTLMVPCPDAVGIQDAVLGIFENEVEAIGLQRIHLVFVQPGFIRRSGGGIESKLSALNPDIHCNGFIGNHAVIDSFRIPGIFMSSQLDKICSIGLALCDLPLILLQQAVIHLPDGDAAADRKICRIHSSYSPLAAIPVIVVEHSIEVHAGRHIQFSRRCMLVLFPAIFTVVQPAEGQVIIAALCSATQAFHICQNIVSGADDNLAPVCLTACIGNIGHIAAARECIGTYRIDGCGKHNFFQVCAAIKCTSADGLNTFGQFDSGQAGVLKGIVADVPDTAPVIFIGRKSKAGQLGAVLESTAADLRDVLGNLKFGNCCHCLQDLPAALNDHGTGIITILIRAGSCTFLQIVVVVSGHAEGMQTGTVIEGAGADMVHRTPQLHIAQLRHIGKSPVADVGDTLFHKHVCDLVVVIEPGSLFPVGLVILGHVEIIHVLITADEQQHIAVFIIYNVPGRIVAGRNTHDG